MLIGSLDSDGDQKPWTVWVAKTLPQPWRLALVVMTVQVTGRKDFPEDKDRRSLDQDVVQIWEKSNAPGLQKAQKGSEYLCEHSRSCSQAEWQGDKLVMARMNGKPKKTLMNGCDGNVAAIEERYGKDLVNLCKKKPCGQTEIHTLKRALDVFKQQIDNIAQCHIQLAVTLREEAKRMEEFRERQRAERKRIEAAMDSIHKQRQLQYKRTVDSKKTYEQRCREKEEAEGNVSRCNKNNMNQKQQDKIYAKLAHSKVMAEDADKTYQQNIIHLDKVREDWQKEHITACMFFENQEWDRINYYRNAAWTHVNQLSQQCVTTDGMCEEVRRVLECCSIEKDIEQFTEGNRTGDKPPAPIPYENFYNNQRSTTPVIRRGPLQTPSTASDDHAYASVGDFNVYQ
ncbi:proline-serine-threonine phosphatase-interacting protein 2-like [Bufo gargarizans]|uniref:proline-serine-threonine phosphatase-interacting protein 2-like n=1 Tax=Bufo gargarizans TaxID=30331 RepID=UPI001CF16C25|nr:proline-serine-threonine phosphatase-interacting protein 2-like [Bufo gargarizans]